MPPVYVCPSRADAEPCTTTYRVFTGTGALFEDGKGTACRDHRRDCPTRSWPSRPRRPSPGPSPTRPARSTRRRPASLYGAGSPHPGGFNVAMADGSVPSSRGTIDPNVFRTLITRNGGEVVDLRLSSQRAARRRTASGREAAFTSIPTSSPGPTS